MSDFLRSFLHHLQNTSSLFFVKKWDEQQNQFRKHKTNGFSSSCASLHLTSVVLNKCGNRIAIMQFDMEHRGAFPVDGSCYRNLDFNPSSGGGGTLCLKISRLGGLQHCPHGPKCPGLRLWWDGKSDPEMMKTRQLELSRKRLMPVQPKQVHH